MDLPKKLYIEVYNLASYFVPQKNSCPEVGENLLNLHFVESQVALSLSSTKYYFKEAKTG